MPCSSMRRSRISRATCGRASTIGAIGAKMPRTISVFIRASIRYWRSAVTTSKGWLVVELAEVIERSPVAAPAVPAVATAPLAARPVWWGPLANRNFRLLWLGENVSLLGDQFYFVALPWLVFQMTGSSLAFGTILMVGGIPRAIFTLVGGAVADRFAPRTVMTVANLLRLGVITLLTLIVAADVTRLWMLYLITLCFGTVDAFFHPAYRAMIPTLMHKDELKASNSLMLSTSQLALIAGPGLAGVLVNVVGVVVSFVFDALTFLFTAVMLVMLRTTPSAPAVETAPAHAGLWSDIGEMIRLVRREKRLQTLVGVLAAINLLFAGPLIVGSATLSRLRFDEGPAAFGMMLSSFAVGMLIGTVAAGVVHPRR
ncbi:MAG: MFS transporter, partial [Chloroflexi bacterium]